MMLHLPSGLRLHYLTWGAPGRTPVLLIHGLQGCARLWSPVAEGLAARGFYVVAPDMRGHGASDHTDDYPIEGFADDAAALLEALQLSPAHVVGHSLGGTIAWTLAARHPASVRRLVIEDQHPEATPGGLAADIAWAEGWQWRFSSREEGLAYLSANGRSVAWWGSSLVARDDGSWGWAFDAHGIVTMARRLYERDRWDDLRQVKAPVLLIHGSESPHLSPGVAERMIATIPRSRLLDLPGDHWVHRRPEPYVAAVADFFGEEDAAVRTGSAQATAAQAAAAQATAAQATAVPTLALPSGERVPMLGQGTWYMGEDRQSRRAEAAALRTGLDLGMTLIDTAEMYGDGGAEEVVGEAMAGRRDEVFLVSKVLPSNASRRGTVEACERSLRRLGTDRIDLYLLHWGGRYSLGETLEGFEALLRAGKIRYWGVSNFDTRDMEELARLAGGSAVATNQVLYNLTRRGIEFDLLPWCRERKAPIMAYSPIEQGRMLNHPALRKVAARQGATPAQVALAWLLRQQDLLVIPKAGRVEHVRENHGALNVQLTETDLAELNRAFPGPTRKMPLEML